MEEQSSDVIILMATYNGEKYIKEQMESILNQTHRDFVLIIRDDGSSDNTFKILQEYEKIDNRIILFRNDSDKHGAYLNFWNLLHYAKKSIKANYYFLSDQDDIWKADKIEASKKYIENVKDYNGVPILLYSDMEVIDENSKLIYPSYNDVMHNGDMIPQATFFTRDIFWGCTMAFNRELLTRIPLVPLTDERINILSHDTYLAEFASLFGRVVYFSKNTIAHRKHFQNVTGNSALKYDLKTILDKIFKNNFDQKAKKHARTYAQSLIALETFEEHSFINDESKKIRRAIETGRLLGLYNLRHYRIKKANISRTVLTYLIMISGKYKKYIPFWMKSSLNYNN